MLTVHTIFPLCSIATDKALVDKQEEIKILQKKITSLTLQLMKREEKINQLMENIKGKQLLDILLFQIISLVLQSQMVHLRNQIKSDDPQLGQMFREILASQQQQPSDDKLTLEEVDERVEDITKSTLSDHVTTNIPNPSKI